MTFKGWKQVREHEIIQQGWLWIRQAPPYNHPDHAGGTADGEAGKTISQCLEQYGHNFPAAKEWILFRPVKEPSISEIFSLPLPLP